MHSSEFLCQLIIFIQLISANIGILRIANTFVKFTFPPSQEVTIQVRMIGALLGTAIS